jgi:hypothetical protein
VVYVAAFGSGGLVVGALLASLFFYFRFLRPRKVRE